MGLAQKKDPVLVKLQTPSLKFKQLFPWWERRQNPDVKPKHLEVSRQADFSGLVTVTFHTAGDNYLWEIPMHYLVNNTELRSQIEPQDLEYLEWMIREDIGVPTQYWTCTDLQKIFRGKIKKMTFDEIQKAMDFNTL